MINKSLHSKALILEAVLILLPVMLISLFGACLILLVQLGERLGYEPYGAISWIFFTCLLVASLIALCAITIRVIKIDTVDNSVKPLHRTLADIGAFFSLIILSAFLYDVIFELPAITVSFFQIYVWGTPALIPYLHLSYLNGGVLSRRRF